MPTAGDDEEAARDGAWEWEEWEERLRTTEATLAVTQPLVREQLALAATYRERMAALRALAERLAGPNMHGRWVRLDDLRSEHNVRFAISTQVHMANGIRESWAAFVNSCVLALDQLFTGVDEGVDAATRAALAAYLDSGGAHVAAERAQCPDVAAAEAHAARVVEDLLRDKIQRPHIHEAKAALCNWSNVLGLVQDALLDYELTAAALTPRAKRRPWRRRGSRRTPTRCADGASARTGPTAGRPLGCWAATAARSWRRITGQPADSLATADAAHTMGLIARWGAGTGPAGPAQAQAQARREAQARTVQIVARWMRAYEPALHAVCAREKAEVERRIEASAEHPMWSAVAVHRVAGGAMTAPLQPPAHLGAFRERKHMYVQCADAEARAVPAAQLCSVVAQLLKQGALAFGYASAAYVMDAVRLDYATHQTHLERIRSDLRKLLPLSEPAQRATRARPWSGISPGALSF